MEQFQAREHPIRLVNDDDLRRSRVTVFFRLLLAIPAFLLAYVFRLLMSVLAFVGWFHALATGRMSDGIENLGNYALGYEAQTVAYALLVTERYPSLGGGPTA
jgi:ABC-type dipeptide/oligopeptide/nickel transport system permease component